MQLPSGTLISRPPEQASTQGPDNSGAISSDPAGLSFATLLQAPGADLPPESKEAPELPVSGTDLPSTGNTLPQTDAVSVTDEPLVAAGDNDSLASAVSQGLFFTDVGVVANPDNLADNAFSLIETSRQASGPKVEAPVSGERPAVATVATLARNALNADQPVPNTVPATSMANPKAVSPVIPSQIFEHIQSESLVSERRSIIPGNSGNQSQLASRLIGESPQIMPIDSKSQTASPAHPATSSPRITTSQIANQSALLASQGREQQLIAPRNLAIESMPRPPLVIAETVSSKDQRLNKSAPGSAVIPAVGLQTTGGRPSVLPSVLPPVEMADLMLQANLPGKTSTERAENRSLPNNFALNRPAALKVVSADAQQNRSDMASRVIEELASLKIPAEIQPGKSSLPPIATIQTAFVSPSVNTTPSSSVVSPATINTPVLDPAWAQAVGERIMMLASRDIQTATIRLNPAELGPLQVRISVDDDAVKVAFIATHAVTREALETAMPRLKEMLTESGLSLAGASVSDQEVANQKEHGQTEAAQDIAPDDVMATESVEELLPGDTKQRVRLGLLDTFA